MRRIFRFATAVFGFCLSLVCSSGAYAYPVTWTLSGATFSDGGTATGSFIYDADTSTLSNWSVSVAGGNTTTFPAITYDTTTATGYYNSSNATTLGVLLSIGLRQIRIPGTSALSDAGGTMPINLSSPAQGECFNCSPFRPFTAGNLVGVAAPAITSANSTTFTVGSAGSFTVTSTGAPVAALSETGTLPSGVTFVDNGNGTATLSGTPAAGTAGAYVLNITANNGVAPNATQTFTLNVQALAVVVPTPMLGLTGLLWLGLLLALAGMSAGICGIPRRK